MSPQSSTPALCRFIWSHKAAAVLLGMALLYSSPALAHQGELDDYGGHFDPKTALYHYHRPKLDMGHRKADYLIWLEYPRKGVLKGVLGALDRPNAFWLRIPYRPAYQELTQQIAPNNRDDANQSFRIWWRHVSPEESAGSQDKPYAEWFRKQAMYEIAQKLGTQELTVQFEISRPAGRMSGMVFAGEENLNLWLVLNGWSYFVLDRGETPHEKLFVQAEDLAKQNKAGLWGRSR